ncbi:breakpoint cluster region protein-like isoform X1 [Haliotis rufescens]|uniref:breakpoint cluster region protein-like isoform X1 n=1 Tax=Haliotis rufescens TaxID=6454 RepID=UPI00201FA4A4|nr:breakpoint cluster region protein-like isoform X1 [Haliotis rufescens]
MENPEPIEAKWREQFADAPIPSVLAGRDEHGTSTRDLRLFLQVTRDKITQLRVELEQQEFIQKTLEAELKDREEKEKCEKDDKFINDYVYSFVGKDKRCGYPPFSYDPELVDARRDSDCVTRSGKNDQSPERTVNGSGKIGTSDSFLRNYQQRKHISWSHSRGDNSVATRAPVPIYHSKITVIDSDTDSDYGKVWVVPSRSKHEVTTRYSTGMLPASNLSCSLSSKQPPPVPRKPSKPQPAPRLSLHRSSSSDLSLLSTFQTEADQQFSSLPRDTALNANTMATCMTDNGLPGPTENTGQNDVSENASHANSDEGCAKRLSSKHSTGLEYTNSKSVITERQCDSLPVRLSTGERPGIQDLCASSLVSAVNISNSLTHLDQVSCQETETPCRQTLDDTDMKKLYRTKSDRKHLDTGDGAKFDQIEGTYRKLNDECTYRKLEDEGTYRKLEEEYSTVSIKTEDCGVVDVPMRNKPEKIKPDSILSDSEQHKSHSSAQSYENWTIDRCLTRQDDSNDSDGSDHLYDNMVFGEVSPASTLQKQPYKGSKDSGLCDDLSTNESSPSVSDSVSVTTEESAVDGGADSSAKPATSDESDDGDNGECVDVQSDSSDDDKNADSISLASDIVFIPASELPASANHEAESRSPEQCRDSHPDIPMAVSPQIKRVILESPVVSSGEEEVSFDETDGVPEELSARDKLLQMRQYIVKGVLESEKSYLAILELLIHYKRSLEASSQTSKPVISEEDNNAIFFNIKKLYAIHQEFVKELEPKVNNWSHDQKIGEIFKMMVFQFPEFGKYMKNYQVAVTTIHRCSQENPQFQEIAGKVTFGSHAKEVTNLEDALFKPVQRVQRNALVLHDLIKYTPEDHEDHRLLRKALDLSQYNLEEISSTIRESGALPQEKRHLVKSSFLVELVSGQRKVRYIFLFSDVLVCTKKDNNRKASNFDVKWIIPLCRLTIDTHFDYQDDLKHSHKENIEAMKKKIGQLKSELRDEVKYEEARVSKHWSISGLAAARSVDKLKRKIHELEAQLILQLPKLAVKLTHEGGKVHTLLMTTDYEREEWLETLTSLCRKCGHDDPSLSTYEVQELVNTSKALPQVNKFGSVLMQKDEEVLNGTLNVTVHKLNGLVTPCDTYCCVEMDSYDHFFMKARTNICPTSADPAWDEDFELELDGSQTLRVLVYKKVDNKSDRLLGRGALELCKSWLKTNFQEKTISMNDVSLVISVRHTPANRTMRRTPSQQKTGVFGVKISTSARREGKTVPSIVTACIQEVEKRGLDETGIYRVSGVTSEVQRLKKAFDKNVRLGTCHVTDCDIHAVTGMLKLYFRELPEPLFTEANYTNFVESLRLSDKEAKEKCMLGLLHNLPDANYYTIVTLLEHLVRVAKNVKENKMTIHNLATVLGPTLLAPAVKDTTTNPLEMMSKTTEQVMLQSAIVNYFLSLAAQGRSLRRSAQV